MSQRDGMKRGCAVDSENEKLRLAYFPDAESDFLEADQHVSSSGTGRYRPSHRQSKRLEPGHDSTRRTEALSGSTKPIVHNSSRSGRFGEQEDVDKPFNPGSASSRSRQQCQRHYDDSAAKTDGPRTFGARELDNDESKIALASHKSNFDKDGNKGSGVRIAAARDVNDNDSADGSQEDSPKKRGKGSDEEVSNNRRQEAGNGNTNTADRQRVRSPVPARSGAFFITETGSVISRHRGTLTRHPDSEEPPVPRDVAIPDNFDQNPDDRIKPTPWYCTRKFKVLAVLVMVLAIAIAVSVPLGVSTGGGKKTESPPPTPESGLDMRLTAIRATLIPVSGSEALDDIGSPQNLAMNWLIYDDMFTPFEGSINDEDIEKLIQRYALAVLYYNTGGEEWFRHEHWVDGQVDECDWDHITCEAGDVVSINTGFSDNNVAGTIPSEVSRLTSIREFAFPFSKISALASEMGLLTDMTSFVLELNALEGSIPSLLYELTSLEILRLNQNALSGTISPSITALSNLKELRLETNFLTGTITSEFHSLASLTHLAMHKNMFHGNLTDVIAGLSNLEVLRLDVNHMAGSIPSEIGTFQRLQDLNLGNNDLESTIPTEVGRLNNLESLALYLNELIGTIPSELGNLSGIVNLFLENNMFEGTIPDELCNVFEQNQEELDLRMDCSVDCNNCTVCDDRCTN